MMTKTDFISYVKTLTTDSNAIQFLTLVDLALTESVIDRTAERMVRMEADKPLSAAIVSALTAVSPSTMTCSEIIASSAVLKDCHSSKIIALMKPLLETGVVTKVIEHGKSVYKA